MKFNLSPGRTQAAKEAIKDGLVLSALIILPLAYLGPGWRAKPEPLISPAEKFRRDHIEDPTLADRQEADVWKEWK